MKSELIKGSTLEVLVQNIIKDWHKIPSFPEFGYAGLILQCNKTNNQILIFCEVKN